jgi:hypothetical protein
MTEFKTMFKSMQTNEINIVTELTNEEKNKYSSKCNQKLLKQFFISNIENTVNGNKIRFNYESERIICGNKLIDENIKYDIS